MSVYSLTLVASALGQEVRNVFFYRTTNPGVLEGTAADLSTGFNGQKVPAITPRLALAYIANSIEVFDLFFPTNISTQGIVASGAIVGENMGTRVAVAMRTNRASRAIRRGQKRFGPIGESQQNGGVLIASEITAFNALGVTLGGVVTGAVANYFPIVVKRVKVTTPDGVTYRLPQSVGEYSAFDIISYTVNQRISTQNTRRLPFL